MPKPVLYSDMRVKSFLNRKKIFLLHLSFWLLYFSYRVYDMSPYLGYQKAIVYVSLPMAFNILASYLHYFYILPAWLKNKRPAPYFMKLLMLIATVITLRLFTENQIFIDLFRNEEYYKSIKPGRVISTLWDTFSFLLFTGMIRFTVNWFDLENKRSRLENEKLVAELNYLKAQINPHFLFNTLHNLNYLVYSGSARATEVIIRLSNIMRYMIYDANKEKVLLKKEIEYMNDYIHLESMRLNQAFKINFYIEGDPQRVEVAPLIMLTFLENAFKHGVSDQEEKCWIDVRLVITDDSVRYDVSNKKLKMTGKNLKSGFGLDNVKKRLLLSYPEKHRLVIAEEADVFKIFLTLNLA
jgi:sensor histidine kinase YesM